MSTAIAAETPIATLQFTNRNSLTLDERRRVAAWLRALASEVANADPEDYDARFRARIFPV